MRVSIHLNFKLVFFLKIVFKGKITLCKEYLVKRKPLKPKKRKLKREKDQIFAWDLEAKCYNYQPVKSSDQEVYYK